MAQKNKPDNRESGLPGGGAGRKEDVHGSGVYPMSGPLPSGDAPVVEQAGWGQGKRGAAGYRDHGESEITIQHTTPEKCRDIMTKNPVCCLPSDSTAQAAQLMMKHDTGMIPVVANLEGGHLVGVVTDRDLALTVVADSRDPAHTSIESVMSQPPIVCLPDDPYEQVLQTMERHQVRRVPMVDRSGRLVGIVSQADIALRVGDKKQTAEVVQGISRPAA